MTYVNEDAACWEITHFPTPPFSTDLDTDHGMKWSLTATTMSGGGRGYYRLDSIIIWGICCNIQPIRDIGKFPVHWKNL